MRPARDAAPARWLADPEQHWWDVVRYGAPGFEAYLRIAFADPDDLADDAEESVVRRALEVLARHTTTPDDAYAAIWEGWIGGGAVPSAPRVDIPHRAMLLFTGPVAALWNAPVLTWGDPVGGLGPAPHLAWPRDRSWCLACEVDEEIEFTVGCSNATADALTVGVPTRVRRVAYGEEAPLYREQTETASGEPLPTPPPGPRS